MAFSLQRLAMMGTLAAAMPMAGAAEGSFFEYEYHESWDTDTSFDDFSTEYPDWITYEEPDTDTTSVRVEDNHLLINQREMIMVSAATVSGGEVNTFADLGQSYTVNALFAAPSSGGYSPTLMISRAMGFELGSGFVRLISSDQLDGHEQTVHFQESTFTTPGVFFEATVMVTRHMDGAVDVDMLLEDPTNSENVWTAMASFAASEASANDGFGSFDELGFRRRGGHAPAATLDSFSIIPEPGSLAVLGMGGLMLLTRRRRG